MTAKTVVTVALALVAQAARAGGGDPCNGRVQPGRWVKMASLPATTPFGLGQTYWNGRRLLTPLAYEPTSGARYDPCWDSWAPISTSGAPKNSGSRFWNGRELVVVGDTRPGAPAFAYDPERDAWTPRGALPPDRPATLAQHVPGSPLALFVRGPKSMGDFGPGGYVWDTRTGRSAPIAGEAPPMRATPASAWIGERFAVWGGTAEPYVGPGHRTPVGDGWVLERRGDAWAWKVMSPRGAPSPRAPEVSARSGSRLLLWGGWGVLDDKAVCPTDGGAYDVATDEWRQIPYRGAPSARAGAIAVASSRWFAVMGGNRSCESGWKSYADGGVFDLETWTWRTFTLPGPVAKDSGDVTVLEDGRILILPLSGNRAAGPWMAILDPATAEVTRVDIPAALRNRFDTQAVVAGKRLFLFGGYRNLPRGDCKGVYPCDMAGPTTETTPDGMIYGP